MKDNLENAFKKSLEEYEVAYDPKAWDAVNTQLNANAAAKGSMLSSAFKWVLVSVLFGTIVTGSYFMWNTDDKIETTETTVVENDKLVEVSDNIEQPNIDKDEAPVVDEVEVNEENELKENSNLVEPQIARNETETKKNTRSQVVEKEVEVKTQENKAKVGHPTPIVTQDEIVKSDKYIVGDISSNSVCIGESIEISNSTKKDKVRFQINGKTYNLDSGKSLEITLNESSPIQFVNEKNELIVVKYVKVNGLPAVDFNLEANIFEGGMPVVIAEAYGDYSNYSWKFDDETELKGPVVRHHFFEKGDYEITLNVEDPNGCESQTSKTVRVRDKYNLMAMDAFKPNGSDVRNRTFIPFSLTERDVRFQMTIVDPIDNGVIFTSSDAENAWDGIDQRTGKMTPSNKTFIWKVQIFNPAPNERPIYAGTVIHN